LVGGEAAAVAPIEAVLATVVVEASDKGKPEAVAVRAL